MDIRAYILRSAYRLFPFSLKGDVTFDGTSPSCELSCIINFYGRIDLLEGILHSLASQDMPKEQFEVILVEDQGGTDEGRSVADRFRSVLNVNYSTLTEQFGRMGYSRNCGLSMAKGRYVLFLDDDTVILQQGFLRTLAGEFEATGAECVVPKGSASYCLIKGKYDYHDPYFPTNRCVAYRRETLAELGGFVSEIIGQEDVEFVIRFVAAGMKRHNSNKLNYFHPPLIVSNLNKAAAVGMSFAKLRKRYPLVVWLMLLANGIRWLPLWCLPIRGKWRMQGRFSAGFIWGAMGSVTGKQANYQ